MQAVLHRGYRCHSPRSRDQCLVGFDLVSCYHLYNLRENKDIVASLFWCLRMCSLGASIGLELIVGSVPEMSPLSLNRPSRSVSQGLHISVRTTSRAARNIVYSCTMSRSLSRCPPTTSQARKVSVACFSGKLSIRMAARCVSRPSFQFKHAECRANV
jgi:hypothetical protein